MTVNTSNAVFYSDATFASTNQPWASGNNTFTAIAKDAYGRINTNGVTVNIQLTNSYSYDLNGNLLSDGTRYFAYDDENQLISVTVSNVWQSQFVYDGKMRKRIERDCSGWNGSSWTQTNEVHYIYDGNLVIQERDVNNLPTVTYTRGNDLSGTMQGAGGIGGLLARSDNTQMIIGSPSAHAYYHADGNGNVTMLINNLQSTVAKYLYDPFGNTLSLSGTLASANTYRFSSKEWNDNAGLYYYLYRFYDPNLQRWPNRDPAISDLAFFETHNFFSTEQAANVAHDAGNLYNFVGDQPLSQFDPIGLLLSASGGVPTVEGVVSWRHWSYLTFTIHCPENTIFQFDHIDYSGAVPGLEATFGVTAVTSIAGSIPPASGLGGLDDKISPNPSHADCHGTPVTVEAWMRTRFSSQNPIWGAGLDSAAGVADYVAGTVIYYDCVPCRCHGSYLTP